MLGSGLSSNIPRMSCVSMFVVFFFFKQKTAYEMLRSLVGSEMCIRDRAVAACAICGRGVCLDHANEHEMQIQRESGWSSHCLLYTSDAADDLLCVDLGGRRIIKKKKQ